MMAKIIVKVKIGKKKAKVHIDGTSIRYLYLAREAINRKMEIIQAKRIFKEMDEQYKEILG